MTIEKYWQTFLEANNFPTETTYFESFYFGNSRESAEELLKLVLDGQKTATSSAQAEYQVSGTKEPQVGDYSIVTDFEGNPQCIIQTTEILKLPFKDMTYAICKLEGEDLTLKTWQEKHIAFFDAVGKQIGYTFSWDMIIIFEIFRVVYR
ncbi:ASCH domain-containing protein [Vagococcus vulneris]|uniref:ASCH domain-containing protein n=1 Tax=Vagococcus vulneris TaxID=1977869 RepID=A0A430A088_9ENTE|nr:ASCH domain-containing protein [Vagococcus vulneris]RST99750.1 hypothetical protein CBF37_03225 [Vagococcus vulneris]